MQQLRLNLLNAYQKKEKCNLSLHKRALLLSYFTVSYNIFEGIVSITLGVITQSIALVGFGLDSFVESLSGSVMIWRFSKHEGLSGEEKERVEKKAIRLIAYTFFILGVYVFYESLKKIYFQEAPEPTLFGIIIAALSLIIMPALFYFKNQTGKSLNSRSLVADSKQTLICVFMSISLLIGLGLNYLYGIWWLDPVIGLLIAGLLFKEGFSALKEEKLCSC